MYNIMYEGNNMVIKYLGHACFSVKNNEGNVLVCDPFDKSIGYSMIKVNANVVTMSHMHHDHNNTLQIEGDFDIVNTPQIYSNYGFNISYLKTYHDEFKGRKRGDNIIYIIECDGVKICHTGDLGHMLNNRHLAEIHDISVLCIPVGGVYTIDKQTINKLTRKLKDKIIIPMHYKTDKCQLPINKLDNYLKTTFLHTYKINELTIDKDNIDTFLPGNYVLKIKE